MNVHREETRGEKNKWNWVEHRGKGRRRGKTWSLKKEGNSCKGKRRSSGKEKKKKDCVEPEGGEREEKYIQQREMELELRTLIFTHKNNC